MKRQIALMIGVLVIAVGAVVFLIFDKINTPIKDTGNTVEKKAAVTSVPEPLSENTIIKNTMHVITLETNFGTIQFETYDADAPKASNNFITLAQKGFYNGLTFHRVIDGFMIQGGDPECNPSKNSGRCGAGGPGYTFEDELNPATLSYKNGYKKGVVAMANAGPNTNGSQFFIMLADYPLPNNYTIFGKVVVGQEVVDKIGKTTTGANDKPTSPVVIKKASVVQKPQ